MNTKRHAISLSLVLALGASAGAQASQANHESEWSNVISYGETTIAHDSPEDFGSWKMMVQPAAGPTGNQSPAVTPVRPLAQATTQAPTPRPAVTPPVVTPPVITVVTPPVVTPPVVTPPVPVPDVIIKPATPAAPPLGYTPPLAKTLPPGTPPRP